MVTHWVGDQRQVMCGSVVQLVSNSSPTVCLQEAKKKLGIHTFIHGRLGKRSGNKFVQISEIISYCDDASFKSRFLPQYWPGVLLNEYHLLS